MKRRELVTGAGAGAMMMLAGCNATGGQSGPLPPVRSRLIDVHNHIFNGSDLPTVRFIKIVVLKHYPKQAVKVLDIDDKDVIDQLIALLTFIVGRTKAPTAFTETRVLDREQPPVAVNTQGADNESAVISAIAEFSVDRGVAVSSQALDNPGGFRKLRRAVLSAAGESGLGVSDEPITKSQTEQIARKAYHSKFDLGLLLRWFALFTRYRYVLLDQLITDHRAQGFDAVLSCPALIDYDHWLGERVDRSPLPAQVAVMGRLARRRNGPVVHGYVGFDPLRQVAWEAGTFKAYDPLALVRRAIREEGFVGVKLYSPMGFRPMGNSDPCQTYPDIDSVNELLGKPGADPATQNCSPRPADGSRRLGELLDGAMAKLFDTCVTEGASILAHTNDSNGAAQDFSKRADPAYWLPVLQKWPKLRVGLAHFGSFTARSVGSPADAGLPQASWEWTVGRFMKKNPQAPVYYDISYLVEMVGLAKPDYDRYAGTLRAWVSEFDPDCRHLMFGTDWTMLGLDPAYEGYTTRVYDFFKNVIGLDKARLDRLFWGNAATFLGLQDNGAGRERLLQFYTRNGLPESRLPRF